MASLSELERMHAVLKVQMDRVVSDIESEKGTRARVNVELFDKLNLMDDRQRKSENFQSKLIGALIAFQFVSDAVILLHKG